VTTKRGSITTELEEIGYGTLLVDIDYWYATGERPFPGYPGSPDTCERMSVYVSRWFVGTEERKRDASDVWPILDEIAACVVDNQWEDFREMCVADARNRE